MGDRKTCFQDISLGRTFWMPSSLNPWVCEKKKSSFTEVPPLPLQQRPCWRPGAARDCESLLGRGLQLPFPELRVFVVEKFSGQECTGHLCFAFSDIQVFVSSCRRAGRGSCRCSSPKFNVVTFLEYCFSAESRLVGETRNQRHCRSIRGDLWTKRAMVLILLP